jgi:hypothetical protein
MTRPCDCDRCQVGRPYTPDQCRACWLFHNDAPYRALWGESRAAPPRSLPCVWLGEVIDRGQCPCPAKWARACAVHGVCTVEICKTCPDYEAR